MSPNRAAHDEPDVRRGRATTVRGLPVTRALPTRGRRTVGPWCFVDLMGAADTLDPPPMEIGPHPHCGLSTVTWLLDGEAVHHDSLGTEQLIRPGQLNLMTAGEGIAHAEIAAPQQRFRGVQLWLAQPDHARHGPPGFEHHAELPSTELDGATALVLVGEMAGVTSAARADTPTIGAQITHTDDREVVVELAEGFEHAVVPLDGPVAVGARVIDVGDIALLPPGERHVHVASAPGERWLLLGGEPIGPIRMWWNFVARTQTELDEAWAAWRDRTDRYGQVAPVRPRIEAPRPPWRTHG